MVVKSGSGGSAPGLLAQSFLTSLPIVLTVGLGFAANYWQSRTQHQEEIETIKAKADVSQKEQTRTAEEAEKSRKDEAARLVALQQGEAEAKLQQQASEAQAVAEQSAIRFAQEQETLQRQQASQRAQQAREFQQSLERQRRQNEADLVLQVIKVGDLAVARSNIEFLLKAGLVADPEGRISSAAERYGPVLPAAGSTSLATLENIEYTDRFWSTTLRPDRLVDIDRIVDDIVRARPRFEQVGAATNTPWYVVGLIWTLESGDKSFSTHLANGDPLTARTVNSPRGIPEKGDPPFTWEEGAIAALLKSSLKNLAGTNLSNTLNQIERYNGLGYRKYNIYTPYLWGGTTEYSAGRFIRDGEFDASQVSRMIGAVAILRRMDQRSVIKLDREIKTEDLK